MLNNHIVRGLVEISKGLNQTYIELEEHTYRVLTEYEIHKEFYYYQMDLFNDLSLNAYSDWAQEYIINHFVNTDWFDDLQYDMIANDFDSMEEEEQMQFAQSYGINDLDDAREMYIKQMMEEDSVQWYRDAVGERDFRDVLLQYNLINFDQVVDYILDEDGYECLATYDGNLETYYDEDTYMTYYVYILD